MHLRYRGKRFFLPVRRVSLLGRFLGLMFCSRNAANLLFEFPSETHITLHSWFVFFPFLVLWLNARNEVQEWRIVQPFTSVISPQKPFRKIVEVPLNKKNALLCAIFVGKERFK